MNIIIPIAGEGRRFVDAGYPDKPFVDVKGKPLIEVVLNSLPESWKKQATFTFITRPEHSPRLKPLFKSIGIDYQIVESPTTTKGAACSVLLAKKLILTAAGERPLIIVNGDQIVKFSVLNFNTLANLLRAGSYAKEVTGVIPVFKARGPKWSYAELDSMNRVTYVAEKDPISQWATCGIYFWSNTNAFFDCAANMIYNERKVNNEYYVAPVYNEIVKYKFLDGTVLALEVDQMIGLGTPEDVKAYVG